MLAISLFFVVCICYIFSECGQGFIISSLCHVSSANKFSNKKVYKDSTNVYL